MFANLNPFSAAAVIKYGKELASRLGNQYPPSLASRQGAGQVSADRLAKILESTYFDAQHYQATHRLGFYKKARLCHAFKWGLHDMGYNTDFIDVATEGLLVYLNKAPEPIAEVEQARQKRERKSQQRAEALVKQQQPTPAATSQSNNYSRSHPSPRYSHMQSLYKEMHLKGESFMGLAPEETFPGLSLPPQAYRIKTLIDTTRSTTILDYGSGKGLQYRQKDISIPHAEGRWPDIKTYWGVEDIRLYDPSYPPLSELPTGKFDGVISTDVLEHCPEEDIPWIVDEIFSFSKKFVFANVACYPAKKRLPNGENAHCTIKPMEWWRERIILTARKHQGVKYEFWIQWLDATGRLIEDVISDTSA
jgi:hypothetical protein